MGSDRERGAEVERLLRSVLRDGTAEAAGACPAPDELAAYVERTLPRSERVAIESHLAACARCQDALAVMAAMPAPDPGPGLSWWRAGWKRWLVPVSALASAVVLYVALRPDFATGPLRPEVASQDSLASKAPVQAPPAPEGTVPGRSAPVAADSDSAPPGRQAPQGSVARRKEASSPPAPAPTGKGTPLPSADVAREKIAPPVATLVGARPAAQAAPSVPPLPLEGEAESEARARPELAEKVEAQGGRPSSETVETAGATRARKVAGAGQRLPLVVRAEGDAQVQWRFEPGARFLRSTDGGKTWRLQFSTPGDVTAASSPSPIVCWAVGAAGLVLRTIDGETWERLRFPKPLHLVAVSAADAAHATVTTREGERYQTVDGGASWRRK